MVLATETENENLAKEPSKVFLGQACKNCSSGIYKETSCDNSWWVQCNDCDSFHFCYVPMAHQQAFHEDLHKIKMYAGKQNLPA